MASTNTDLDDAEFWLPSHFLTDDDILSDFGFGSGSGSASSSTEPETSDDDDHHHLLTRPFSTSPQSTLFGCDSNSNPTGSTPGSPTPPVQLDDHVTNTKFATLDLLNKAAGEVAKITTKTGTGFFDCSNTAKKGLFCPPPPSPLPQQYTPPFYPRHLHFPRYPPHIMRGPIQQQQNRVTNTNKNNGNNRPLGLPPSAWPPLPGQNPTQNPTQNPAQAQGQAQPNMGMFVAPQRDSVGTGVFLPRGVTAPTQPKKKSDGKVTKTKNNKNTQRQSSRAAKANEEAIGLPSEWVY